MNKLSIKRQAGAGLIEILISVVVLAVGLTGIAAMQVRSVKNNVSALEHSIAVIQAQSMGDTLAISRTQALAGNFNISLNAGDPSNTDFAPSSVKQWRTSIRSLLGDDATGSVNCVSPNCTIIVQWNNNRATEGSATQQIRVEMHL
ncbi:MAG TPA: hypothetical protein PLM98_14945 [Thiolinea sp.]|nr:hypothetical protein [Thiolinea sp.]